MSESEAVNAVRFERYPHVFEIEAPLAALVGFWGERMGNGEFFWVAPGSGAQVVGFVSARLIGAAATALLKAQRIVRIGSIGVDDAQEGRGLGTQLLEAVVEFGRANGAVDVRLDVWEFNQRAIALYERQGFATHTRTMPLSLREQGAASRSIS
jgi:ribosomal protein S18 acetylase RimI-like enzyme